MSRKKTVAVAMSGGVDSSVAASLLLETGWRVIGLTMRLREDPGENKKAADGIISAAREAARTLGIPHRVVDLRKTFERNVVRYFCEEYAAGRTPNPCVRCNRLIKFGLLRRKAVALGADFLATGHYARVEWDPAARLYRLKKGRDRLKDQSYFLYALGQEELSRSLLPLGDWTKASVRRRARALGLRAVERPESQEICFVPDDNYPGFLERRIPGAFLPGPIVDPAGAELGRHSGIARYTVGQRRGLGIAAERPLYVLALDAETNRIVVGPDGLLMARKLAAVGVNWVSGRAPERTLRLRVKIRSRQQAAPAEVSPGPGGQAVIEFRDAQRAVTPGQAVVFYRGAEVLGGGTICRRLD